MELVKAKEAVGMVLCHDITKIVPGEFKGRLYKKGHIITEDDIPQLLDVGKEHIYVWDLKKGYVHEDDAALRIARAAAGPGISLTEPVEGKIEFVAKEDGLLKINRSMLDAVNSIDDVMMATIQSNQVLHKGKRIGGTRIIPLVIEEMKLRQLEAVCTSPVMEIFPIARRKVGLIITGSEVYSGRIKDGFGPVVEKKLQNLKSEIIDKIYVSDSIDFTSKAIINLIKKGADMVILTGGMSVDPDDLTPASIEAAGGKTVVYGVPVLPGAMFMLSYIDNIPVIGLPGCVMYYRASIFDLVIPRILAGEKMNKKDFSELAYGGFCLGCDKCRFPDCGYGKA